ncbi:MAG TPA: hypothetical protein P5159_18425 [Phycisphaerae bacterium]|nr:hypothetical protein [Phycisphaerae bacterium]
MEGKGTLTCEKPVRDLDRDRESRLTPKPLKTLGEPHKHAFCLRIHHRTAGTDTGYPPPQNRRPARGSAVTLHRD